MDPLLAASLFRAQNSISQALKGNGQRERAKSFIAAARAILKSGSGDMLRALRESGDPIVEKTAAHLRLDEEWDRASDGLATAYIDSIAEISVIDALRRYGRTLPRAVHNVLIASAAVGDVVQEGQPKPVRRLDVNGGEVEPVKSCALLVLSEELVAATDGEAERLFERELSSAVGRASNRAVLDALAASPAATIASSGDPLEDLRAGLRAAPPSNGFVCAMPAGAVADLALRTEAAPGFTVRGGVFKPGIFVSAIDDASDSVIVPASRVALWDSGLSLRSARHADVTLVDEEENELMVNMWQRNLLGLLVERSWSFAQATGVVLIAGGTT